MNLFYSALRTPHSALILTLLLWASLARAQPADGWYAGDTHVHTAIHAVSSIPERVEEGIRGGLDWVAITRHVRSGAFWKAAEVDSALSRHYPRIAPLLGMEWDEPPELGQEDIVILGVNRHAPIPRDNLQAIIDYANREGGIFIFAHPSAFVFDNIRKWHGYTAFEGYSGPRWNDACNPGGAWDRLLSEGGRLFIVGASDNHDRPYLGDRIVKTYVRAKSNHPADITEGIRAGRVYVSERDQIRMVFEADGHGMGETVRLAGPALTVSIQATGQKPILRMTLIGNGQPLWTLQPDTMRVAVAQRIPVPETLRYVRLIVETEDARAMSNPIFLTHEGAAAKAPAPAPAVHPLERWRQHVKAGPDAWKEAQAYLMSQLDDPDPEQRMTAAYGLVDLHLPEAKTVIRALAADTLATVRAYAARMLAGFAMPGDLDLIKRLLADADAQVRLWGVRALETSRSRAARGLLLDMLDDPAYWVHYAAMEGLLDLAAADSTVFDDLAARVRAGALSAAEPFNWAPAHRKRAVVDALQQKYARQPDPEVYRTLERLGASPAAR